MPRLSPGSTVPAIETIQVAEPHALCDADDVAIAIVEITIDIRYPAKRIYLCGHHYNQHRSALTNKGYEFRLMP